MNWSNLLSGLIGSIIGALFGSGVTFYFEWLSKNTDIKHISLNTAHYIAFLLSTERGSLESINRLVSNVEKTDIYIFQKMFVRTSLLGIKQGSLEKILRHQKFHCYDYTSVAEKTYRICFELVNIYNQSIQKLLEAKSSLNKNQDLEKGYEFEAKSNFDNIKNQYQEAVQLNENAIESFDKLCAKVFKKAYKPIKTNGIIKAVDIPVD